MNGLVRLGQPIAMLATSRFSKRPHQPAPRADWGSLIGPTRSRVLDLATNAFEVWPAETLPCDLKSRTTRPLSLSELRWLFL